jgi:antitoxin component YwqK of YwqJK toxin-antitoxin module
MRFRLLVLLASILACSSATAETLYQSDESGIALRKVEPFRSEEFEWVLKLDSSRKYFEVRTLFHRKLETKRWERELYPSLRVKIETQYEGKTMTLRSRYYESGQLETEERFFNGMPTETITYLWTRDRLVAADHTPRDESPYTDFFSYTPQGLLREVERREKDGKKKLSRFSENDGRLLETWTDDGDGGTRETYDTATGRISAHEEWKSGAVVSRTTWFYDGATLVSTLTEDLSAKTSVNRTWNGDGKLAEEVKLTGETETGHTTFVYTNSLLVARTSRSGSQVEKTTYSYGKGDSLEREDHIMNGRMVKSIVHTSQNEYHEDLYREGNVFQRSWYRDAKKISEEFILNGITRTRTFD